MRDARATQTPSPLSARVAPLARTGAQGLLTIARLSAASDRERGTASKRSLGRWAQEESERDRSYNVVFRCAPFGKGAIRK